MRSPEVSEPDRQWLRVLGTLNEMQARLFVAQRAAAEGRGAVSRLARLTGMSRPTIQRGIAELTGGKIEVPAAAGRIRRAGSGRRRVEEANPAIARALGRLLAESTRGDPMSALRWTNKSTRTLAAELDRQGYTVSHVTVARCLEELGYSLQANQKTLEGRQHPDRDSQFRYINQLASRFRRSGGAHSGESEYPVRTHGPHRLAVWAGRATRRRGGSHGRALHCDARPLRLRGAE